ncbi:MAG: ATP-grasp domain-containing protein [Candidatus Daviesbacteria bacterium]|nr:MAG: ATP-grasp domain-containing protein [Candidatus Daviesbacteria bacterium]
MEILILYNRARELKKGIPSDLICEQEMKIIVPLVADLLQNKGYGVQTLRTEFGLWEQLKKRRKSVDLVLNLAEGFGGGNSDEPLVPAMLEALNVPFTGASARNMYFTLDKEKTKVFLHQAGIPIPKWQLFRDETTDLSPDLQFPLIVKPVREEASIGIYEDSVVTTEVEMKRKVSHTLARYKQPALVEQYIEGRELSVGIIGNYPDLDVLPPLEFLFEDATSPLQAFRSYEYKWGGRKEQMVRANITRGLHDQLVDYARVAFIETECQDYARMDYRIDKEGNPYLLEVNYNPGIGPNTHGLNNTLTMMASFKGLSFEDMVEDIILSSAKRYGIATS